MFLLDDILLAPLKGVAWVAEKLREVADKELFDPDKIREELMSLQAKLDMGDIGEEQYREIEKALLERLTAIQNREK
ncbi:MAG: gas vesicle protein GvpG [Deltaproteobacteria bacterium]|nr:gas vesicle protein GvpG [Deltaproteobacteria bacterium]